MKVYEYDRVATFWLLRVGLIVSIILMCIGGVLKIMMGQYDIIAVPLFSLFNSDLSLGDTLMGMGILVLTLTPFLRVLLLTAIWIYQKDWVYVGVGLVVILTLITSFIYEH